MQEQRHGSDASNTELVLIPLINRLAQIIDRFDRFSEFLWNNLFQLRSTPPGASCLPFTNLTKNRLWGGEKFQYTWMTQVFSTNWRFQAKPLKFIFSWNSFQASRVVWQSARTNIHSSYYHVCNYARWFRAGNAAHCSRQRLAPCLRPWHDKETINSCVFNTQQMSRRSFSSFSTTTTKQNLRTELNRVGPGVRDRSYFSAAIPPYHLPTEYLSLNPNLCAS